MVTTVPKRVLIQGILDEYSRESISQYFHIGGETDLSTRLESFNKDTLFDFMTSTDGGRTRLADLQRRYPLGKPPTLYLMYVNHRPEFDEIIANTTQFSEAGRDSGLVLGESKSVRIVFADHPGYPLPFRGDAIEIPIRYERRFEYNIGDPLAENYGEHVTEYSLEQAYIWLIENFSHGIICCNDFVAVNPILRYASLLNIECGLPNLTEAMLNQLAANASPRSATFSRQDIEQGEGFDVKTLIVADPTLENRNTYLEIKNDESHHQTSGFYNNHPNLAFGGIGISRRYGRIWTPVHLSRNNLVALSVGLINSTEQELGREYERSSNGYVSYFRNIPVVISDYVLKGRERSAFDFLITAILDANKRNSEAELTQSLLHNLVKHQNHLGVVPLSTYDCPNCGQGILGKCLHCAEPYKAKYMDNNIVFECPKCNSALVAGEAFQCECGDEIQLLSVENHLQIYPETGLLSGIRHFLSNLDDVDWDGTFLIDGQILRLIDLPDQPHRRTYRLDDLRIWRTVAKYHVREIPAIGRQARLKRILNKSREKCDINNYHPSHEDCDTCLERAITAQDVMNGEICLPRIMGLAISQDFDGVHHRYEIADVKYHDNLEQDGRRVHVGIHLKSRERNQQRVGRGNKRIKGLYTQTLFSAYQALIGEIDLDIIGISIPNEYIEDVVESIQELFSMLGLSLLILDWEDWLKILETVLEQLEFQEN